MSRFYFKKFSLCCITTDLRTKAKIRKTDGIRKIIDGGLEPTCSKRYNLGFKNLGFSNPNRIFE
jgi:hypothetical protein